MSLGLINDHIGSLSGPLGLVVLAGAIVSRFVLNLMCTPIQRSWSQHNLVIDLIINKEVNIVGAAVSNILTDFLQQILPILILLHVQSILWG